VGAKLPSTLEDSIPHLKNEMWGTRLLIVNKDPNNAQEVNIAFEEGGKLTPTRFTGEVKMVTFGAAEYVWHSSGAASHADPDGPPKRTEVEWKGGQKVLLPKASITVLTGRVVEE